MKRLSATSINQLVGSVEKLMHYLAVYVKHNTTVQVSVSEGTTYSQVFMAPSSISISPTLYTRIDDCHGAGNCCRVPFDLVYTGYDRQRILEYDHQDAAQVFGKDSADGFQRYRDQLLERLVPFAINIKQDGFTNSSTIYVQINDVDQMMSHAKSCPYLVMGGDRYFCGVHPFKPLHCWYPHMTVRVNKSRAIGDCSTVSIGRMQYGRNHKFGCPVEFTPSFAPDDDALFIRKEDVEKTDYFEKQFRDDINKLAWTSKSAASLGFDERNNFVIGIHDRLEAQGGRIRSELASGRPGPITLWKNESTPTQSS